MADSSAAPRWRNSRGSSAAGNGVGTDCWNCASRSCPREVHRNILRGNVNQAGLRIERHRMPVVRSIGSGDAVEWLVTSRLRDFDRPTIGVIAGGPVTITEILRRDEFAVGAVDDKKEAVFRRLPDHLARRAADIDVVES